MCPVTLQRNTPKLSILRYSAIVICGLTSLCIDSSSSMRVHVNYTKPTTSVPDEFRITLHPEFGASVSLDLKRVHHISANVPVFTLNVDKNGKHVHRQEVMEDHQNIAYYQDEGNAAVFQVTRVSDVGDTEARLVLRGELSIAGKKYSLSPGSRFRRDESSFTLMQPASSNEPYSLILQDSRPVVPHDYIEAPPEIRRTFIDDTTYEIPAQLFASTQPNITLENSTSSSSSSSSSPERRRRQTQPSQNYYIDVVLVVDYAAYKRFLAGSGSKSSALQALREYYAFVYSGVDMRYQGIKSTDYVLHIRLIKIIIAETADASSFTEMFRIKNVPWDEVDAQSALSAFSTYAAESGSDVMNPYDHAMLITGCDLTSTLTPAVNTNATTGLAFTSTLCRTDGKSVSVVEDLGGFQAVDTSAHEIGHSLGSRHDGDGNTCSSFDRFIMASGSFQVTAGNKLNPWSFSSCSVSAFTNFISATMRTSRGETCLTLPLAISPGVPDVRTRLPGQEFSPDEQCKMIYGSGSRLCRGTEFGNPANVCTSMFCFDPSTTNTCYEQTAAMGTTCGEGRLCLNGECVLDSRAPLVDDDCVFGDQPGIAFDTMSCPDFVNTFSGYCYQALVRGRCCASCKQAYRPVKGCEYGDMVRGCTSNVCSFATKTYLEQCCGTCNYGTRFTITTKSPQRTSANGNSNWQTTPANMINVDPSTCKDNPLLLVNGLNCRAAVSSNPGLCYEANISTGCCSSCQTASSGVSGCEYGDRSPSSCKQGKSCVGMTTECCQTCSSTASAACSDQQNIRLNNMTCAAAVSRFPHYCYTSSVLDACCLSCKWKSSGIKNCEYGDRTPQRCKSVTQPKDCDQLSTECCSTCMNVGQGDIITSLSFVSILCFCLVTRVLSSSFALLL